MFKTFSALTVSCLVFACAGPNAQFKAPLISETYGERLICVPVRNQPAFATFACGNENARTTTVIDPNGHAIIDRREPSAEPVIALEDTECVNFTPLPNQQCGFPPNTPLHSTAILILPQVVSMTLIATDRLQLVIDGMVVRVAYPLDDNGRTFLMGRGLPENVVHGL